MISKTLLLTAVLISLIGPRLVAEDRTSARRPNIVWIMAEDISTDLECYGTKGVRTPALNRLAAEGVRYTNVFASSPICSPNRTAMMTGVHQNIIGGHHHRSNRNRPLPDPYKPITFWLRQAGYVCILGNNEVNNFRSRSREGLRGGGGSKIDVNFKSQPLGEYDGISKFGLFDKEGSFDSGDKPFFAQITLMVTHRGDWWEHVSSKVTNPVDPSSVELPPYLADHPIVRKDWAQYLDQVQYMDSEVARILDQLERNGLADNTVVIFIGDNGRENIRGKGYLHDSGLRVPMIVRWPASLHGGQVNNTLIETTDIAASILQIAGVALPEYLTGRPFIDGNSVRSEVISARDLFDEILDRSRSVTTKEYRYIRNDMPAVPYDAGSAYIEFHRPGLHIMRRLKAEGKLVDPLQLQFLDLVKPVEELYDLVNDPNETRNLAVLPAYRNVLEDLRTRLLIWESKLPPYIDRETEVIQPLAPPIWNWVRYTKPELHKHIIEGGEVSYGDLIRDYRATRP